MNHGDQDMHWTHLALRALLEAGIRPFDLGGYVVGVEDLMTSEVAEATRKAFDLFGRGPVPAGWLGSDEVRKAPLGSLLLLLKLCRAIETEERLVALGEPMAVVTVHGADSLDTLQWAMKALLPDHDVGQSAVRSSRKNDRHLTISDMLSVRKSQRFDRMDRMFEAAANAAVLLTVEGDSNVPRAIAASRVMHLELAPADETLVRWLLSVLHPDLSPDALAALLLPEDGALATIGTSDLLAALRNPSPERAVAALHALLVPVKAEAGLRLIDLAGYGDAKGIALQIVEDLAAWKRGELAWEEVSRGLLLCGPPGTGKTELARAMVREAGIRFVSGSYAEWQKHGHLGLMLDAMDKTFASARAAPPAIVFLDEIDAFGSRQSSGKNANASYDAKVITALLQHLDGIKGREGVIVIGACNHVETLDPAIRRAGRFDRTVWIGLPGLDDLSVILRQHLGADLPDADLPRLAALAQGRTGADCAAAIRSARATARRQRRALTEADLEQALVGSFEHLSPDMLYRTAIHEAG